MVGRELAAELLGVMVVDQHERLPTARRLAGSISRYCISYATCPVVTVPAGLAHAAPEPSGENSRHDKCALIAAN
jgi:hypothetical protein